MDRRLEILEKELASAITGLTAEQLRWRPPGKWSAAEVLEHLYLTYTGTTKGLSRVLAAQKTATTPATWIQRRNRMVVLDLGYLPSGREAPVLSRPRGLAVDQVVAEIAGKVGEMDGMITRCEQELGAGILLDHPILGPLTGRQWRKFHLVHGRHHLRQIRLRTKMKMTGS